MKMRRGERVVIIQYGGRELLRRVIADRGELIDVCNEEEYKKALVERRRPHGIGFRRDAVTQLRNTSREPGEE